MFKKAPATAQTIVHRSNKWHVYVTGGDVFWKLYNSAWKPADSVKLASVPGDKWVHILLTWESGNGGKMKGYLNGVKTLDTTDSDLTLTVNPDTTAPAGSHLKEPEIGGYHSDASTLAQRFTGEIDDLAIWDITLTPEQALAVYKCGVDSSESGVAIRGSGSNMAQNTSLFTPHTGLTLAQHEFALCATTYVTVTHQGGWWPHSTVRDTVQGRQADGNYITQNTDWQGPFPQQAKGDHYLDNPYMKYRNVFQPHQGALHQLRSRKITVGTANAQVATGTSASYSITTGLNGEQASWPYTTGSAGPDRSTSDLYHSAGVHTKLIQLSTAQSGTDAPTHPAGNYLGWPGNGDANHCAQSAPGGGAVCSTHSVIGLEHSDPNAAVTTPPNTGGTVGYTTWAGGTQGQTAQGYTGTDGSRTPIYSQKPVEGENGYMPTHTPHPTRQPEFYPTYGNHFKGDSGELGSNEYPMTHLTDCNMHMRGSLALNTGTCMQPGYKLANGLHPGTYLFANN
jgi:hypothetical protein